MRIALERDDLTAAPGARVSVNVLGNDIVAPDDSVTIAPLASLNKNLPSDVTLSSPTGPIQLTAPGLTGKPMVLTAPKVECSTSTTMSRASVCGSLSASSMS